MAPQGLPTLDHPRGHLSRQSSEVDYEIAEQLIQHAQGRRDVGGNDVAGIAPERKTSPDFSPGDRVPNDDQGVEGNNSEPRQGNRRSSSQERQPEEKYAPINIPVAMGQVCR
jgi:hypothetical protein